MLPIVYPATHAEDPQPRPLQGHAAGSRGGAIIYKSLVRPLLFRLPPERAQNLADAALTLSPAWSLAAPVLEIADGRLHTRLAGLDLPNPIGAAAGLDKACTALGSLISIGFGFVVGGTITLAALPGNPRPRLLRDTSQGALINSLGFPGPGLDVAERRLRNLGRKRARVFASVAGTVEEEILECCQRVAGHVAVVEVNVSSPNTAGLRIFHQPPRLRALIEALSAATPTPLLVKLPPWEDDAEARTATLRLAETAVNAGASGVVIANTRPVNDARLAVGRGGLSGRPLLPATLRMVRETVVELGRDASIVACGGISEARDAWELIACGASAVELYTGFVYEGPSLPGRLNRGLLRLIERAGLRSVQELRASRMIAPVDS